MHALLRFLLLLLLPASLSAQSPTDPGTPERRPPPAAPAPQPASAEASRELAEKQEELAKVTERIAQIQARAEASEAVRPLKEKYQTLLESEMVRSSPELKSDIERRAQLSAELAPLFTQRDADPAKLEPAQQQRLAEYRALEQKLEPLEERVRETAAVEASRRDYYNKLIAEMERIEPETPTLLAKHGELTVIVRELAVQASAG